jgi:hypothetical protein
MRHALFPVAAEPARLAETCHRGTGAQDRHTCALGGPGGIADAFSLTGTLPESARRRLIMKRLVLALVAYGTVVAACASTGAATVSVTHTTSAEPATTNSCYANDLGCTQNEDCCSFWCVNGECEQREP